MHKKYINNTMRLALIAAMDKNRLIGRENTLPWRLPADMRHFKAITMGKPVIMGRKTHESISIVLPGRKNIVVTRNEKYRSKLEIPNSEFQSPNSKSQIPKSKSKNSDLHIEASGVVVVHSFKKAIEAAEGYDEVVVIGGASFYREALAVADRMYLTFIDAEFEGDTYFPEIHFDAWQEIERQDFEPDEKNRYPYSFVTLERRVC